MNIALICLPHYLHTKRLILQQLSALDHHFFVLEEARGEGGFDRLSAPANFNFVPLDSLDHDEIAALVRRLGIERVISFSDRGLLPAARLREALGLPGNDVRTETWVVDKSAMRRRLHECGLSKIGFAQTTVGELEDHGVTLPLPVIVKPTSLSGSLCVELVESADALASYVARCRANKVFRNGQLAVEEYMPGPEFSVEGLIVNGEIRFLGVTESHTSGAPYFVGTGHDFFASHPQARRIEAFVAQVIDCLAFRDCPFHIEAKDLGDRFEVIEVHTRYGGAMIMELVQHATGFAPFADYVRTMYGESPAAHGAADGTIYSQHLLSIGEGRIERLRVELDLGRDPRVISHAVDYAQGDIVERDILPVNYLGYVTFRSSTLQEANAFRRHVDRHIVAEIF
jgi:hypothetical protein